MATGYYVDGGPVPVSGSTTVTQGGTTGSTSSGTGNSISSGGASSGTGFRPQITLVFRTLVSARRRPPPVRGIFW